MSKLFLAPVKFYQYKTSIGQRGINYLACSSRCPVSNFTDIYFIMVLMPFGLQGKFLFAIPGLATGKKIGGKVEHLHRVQF